MSPITFKTKPFKIGSWTIVKLPKSTSAKLPSRGIVMVKGTINNSPFRTVLEPDGVGSHWFRVNAKMGGMVSVTIELSDEWLEPEVSEDFKKTLRSLPKVDNLWNKITPNARWEWVR